MCHFLFIFLFLFLGLTLSYFSPFKRFDIFRLIEVFIVNPRPKYGMQTMKGRAPERNLVSLECARFPAESRTGGTDSVGKKKLQSPFFEAPETFPSKTN